MPLCIGLWFSLSLARGYKVKILLSRVTWVWAPPSNAVNYECEARLGSLVSVCLSMRWTRSGITNVVHLYFPNGEEWRASFWAHWPFICMYLFAQCLSVCFYFSH